VIDLTVYWRPASYAAAVVAVDCALWVRTVTSSTSYLGPSRRPTAPRACRAVLNDPSGHRSGGHRRC
jgi:hypothetical protein